MAASIEIPQRVLLGPGPSDVPARVLQALGSPTIGHLDPVFLQIMDEVRTNLRQVFGTNNEMTLAVSGTGSAGMETVFVNLIEPGDRVLIGVNGVFGGRMTDVAKRCGADVQTVEAPWGRIIEQDAFIEAMRKHRPTVAAIVHAETSTGVHQPVDRIGAAAREAGALFLIDCVTSLGGLPVEVDRWQVDAAYSGTQKCLSCPPGLSPITFGPRAVEVLTRRKTKVQSWYLDLSLLAKYWGEERVYHHTAPISMNYALREALRLVDEDGLRARYARHALHHRALAAGLGAMGLSLASQEGHRLPMLNAVAVPDGVAEDKVRSCLLDRHGIEIGAGLGPMKGKVWRIGLMGESCRRASVLLVLSAIEQALQAQGRAIAAGAGLAAAAGVYES